MIYITKHHTCWMDQFHAKEKIVFCFFQFMGLDSVILCFLNRLNLVFINCFSIENFYQTRNSITMIFLFHSCTIARPSTKPFSALPLQDLAQTYSQLYYCKTKHIVILSFNIAIPSTKPVSALPLQDQAQSYSHLYTHIK